jgi:hypothetical protein
MKLTPASFQTEETWQLFEYNDSSKLDDIGKLLIKIPQDNPNRQQLFQFLLPRVTMAL